MKDGRRHICRPIWGSPRSCCHLSPKHVVRRSRGRSLAQLGSAACSSGGQSPRQRSRKAPRVARAPRLVYTGRYHRDMLLYQLAEPSPP